MCLIIGIPNLLIILTHLLISKIIQDQNKSSGTPDFKHKIRSNVFSFQRIMFWKRKDSVDYNEPSRYLYEFFTHK